MSTVCINRVMLTGNLTRDPELRTLPSGNSVCDLRLAVDTKWRNPAGSWNDQTNYFDVSVFGSQGETVAKYMHKGRPVAVDGRLRWREWETKDGRKAQAVNIIAETVQFLGVPDSAHNGNGNGEEEPGGVSGGDRQEPSAIEDEALLASIGDF